MWPSSQPTENAHETYGRWLARQETREQRGLHPPRGESVFEEFAVFEETPVWTHILKSFHNDMDRAFQFAAEAPNRFVLQRTVTTTRWQ